MNFEKDHYGHGTIRKLIVAFGTVFNGIKIKRKDDDNGNGVLYSVPIMYGPKSHFYHRLEDGLENTVSLPTPRIGFAITSMGYDSTRGVNRLNQHRFDTVEQTPTGDRIRKRALSQVPWFFNFSLSIYSKYMEDTVQIMEQFLPYFSPTVNLKILEIPELDLWSDIQISLENQPPFNDSFEDGFSKRRNIITDFDFKVSGWLYPPVREQKVITKVIADIDNPLTDYRYDLETITVQAAPGETENKNNHIVQIEIDV